jgi:hypothetical protein
LGGSNKAKNEEINYKERGKEEKMQGKREK